MKNKIALVTGASSGLGLATIEFLLSHQYFVYGVSRMGAPIENGNYVDVLADLSIEKEVEKLFALIDEEHEEIDLLVHAAGESILVPLSECSGKELMDEFRNNALTTFNLLTYFQDFIKEEHTRIFTYLSLAAEQPMKSLATLCVSKSAVKSILDCFELEWLDLGVQQSQVYFGPVDTPFWDEYEGEDDVEDNLISVDDFMQTVGPLLVAPEKVHVKKIYINKNKFLD